MKKISKLLPVIIAVIQWSVTTILHIDRLYFKYENINKVYIAVKIGYLFLLVFTWIWLFNAIREIKEGNPKYKRGFQVFLFYLIVMSVCTVVLWPGTWSWDDIGCLNVLQWYSDFVAWQHILTGIYMDILLQILPFPGGFIILQNIIVAICVAFVVTNLENYYDIKKIKNKYVDIFIKTLPFYLPPILMYQFSGYRMGLYIYIELVMLVMIIGIKKSEDTWDWKKIILFSCLTVIAATWRTEAFLYIGGIGGLILLTSKFRISLRKKICCIAILFCGFYCVNTLQNISLNNENYKIMSVICPCTEVVRAADRQEDSQLLDTINKVVDLETIYNNPDLNGENLYWNSNVIRKNYTEKEYKKFIKAFVKLSMKYPKVVIKERWNVFVHTSGIEGDTFTNVSMADTLFDNNDNNETAKVMFESKFLANKPISRALRKAFINILGCRDMSGVPILWIQKVIWNAIIPIVILILGWVRLCIAREWYLWFILSLVLIKLPIIILTEPASWFMYVLSFYMIGYVYLLYTILSKMRYGNLKVKLQ